VTCASGGRPPQKTGRGRWEIGTLSFPQKPPPQFTTDPGCTSDLDDPDMSGHCRQRLESRVVRRTEGASLADLGTPDPRKGLSDLHQQQIGKCPMLESFIYKSRRSMAVEPGGRGENPSLGYEMFPTQWGVVRDSRAHCAVHTPPAQTGTIMTTTVSDGMA